MGRRKGRAVNGLLLLNKPLGISSNAALQRAKRLYGAAKAGHTGTLDPLATGVLPICFGEATKFSQFLLASDKGYRATVRLGIATTTGDSEGEQTSERDVSHLHDHDVAAALEHFRGEITQIPSMYSALKHNGQPLYKLARQGKTVERKSRQVNIHELVLEDFRPGAITEIDIRVDCSKGTYIRCLAEDLGKTLACGAHVSALHRFKVGQFNEAGMFSLDAVENMASDHDRDMQLIPIERVLADMPTVSLGDTTGYYLQRGQAVQVPSAPEAGLVKLILDTGEFVGIGEILDDGRVAPRRLVASS